MSDPAANLDPIRRLTNQELWKSLVGWTPESTFRPEVIERELEWRLRKIAFLPALPPKGESCPEDVCPLCYHRLDDPAHIKCQEERASKK